MKKLILLLLVFSNCFSQVELPKFKLTQTGVEPIVIELNDKKSSEEIYRLSKEWIQKYFKNPDYVSKSDIENSFLKVVGLQTYVWKQKNWGYDMRFTMNIDIKDGRYRLTYFIDEFIMSDGTRCLFTYADFFDKNGNITPRSEKGDVIPSINNAMNKVSLSLYNYINGINQDDKW